MLRPESRSGLLGVLDANQHALRRYLLAHGAGEATDDLLQELRLRLLAGPSGPVQSPLGYLYRMATNLAIDHRRSMSQAHARDGAWGQLQDRFSTSVDSAPGADQNLAASQALGLLRLRLQELPDRARRILLTHRIDGVSQRLIASELGISQSTVESDLRVAYRWLELLRREWNEENQS